MKRRTLILPAASRDIDDAIEYIAARSEQGANAVEEAIRATIEAIARDPRVGTPHRFRSPLMRSIRSQLVTDFRQYRVYFRAGEDHVLIIRVLHAARDRDSLLGPEDYASRCASELAGKRDDGRARTKLALPVDVTPASIPATEQVVRERPRARRQEQPHGPPTGHDGRPGPVARAQQ